MGGDRRPAADKRRMLGTPAAPDEREFGHAWRALAGEFGLPAPRSLLRLAMMRCAARWVQSGRRYARPDGG